jgi:alpha-beta hydrolase superfamily lysophospholipase
MNVDGQQVRVYQWNRTAQKTVLILHGFGSSAYKFQRYVQLLKAKNYRVLAIDAPAHGRSEGKRVHALQYAAAIRQTVQEFGPVQSFMAHSFGGIALALALEQLPHQPTDRVVFIAPATETTSAVAGAFELLRLYDKEVQRLFYAHIEQLSGKPVAWFSIPRALQHIQAEVLWCHDETDLITPFADLKPLLERTPKGLEFFITRGLGHRKIYHDNAVKNKVVDFL